MPEVFLIEMDGSKSETNMFFSVVSRTGERGTHQENFTVKVGRSWKQV